MGLLQRFFGGPDDIAISVSPDRFVFRARGREVAVPAAALPGKRRQIGSVAADTALLPSPGLPLFPDGGVRTEPAVAALRYVALCAVLHDGITAVLEHRFLRMRPHVAIRGAAGLATQLHGYQYELLRRAAFDAGALTVRFVEPSVPLPASLSLPARRPEPA